jgi:hypothetical protein
MQVKDGYCGRLDIDQDIGEAVMLATVLIAANMCLQGGELVDISRYVDPAASFLGLKVTLEHATGTLVVYSPGYEEQRARFTESRIIRLDTFCGTRVVRSGHRRSIRIQDRSHACRIWGLMPCKFAS